MHENIVLEACKVFENKKVTNTEVLDFLFGNKELNTLYESEIRRNTVIGKLANEIFEKLKINYECKIMAIGDIEYFGKMEKRWNKLIKKSLKNINVSKLEGYDLPSMGSEKFREIIFLYISYYYGIENLKDIIVDKIIPSYGCTDGFSIALDTIRESNNKVNFIYPEASFISSINIAESNGFKCIGIKKSEKSKFFINIVDVKKYYSRKNTAKNIFYITPVGNPTGEKLNTNDLYNVLNEISYHDKNAIIILDNVYVGLLGGKTCRELFQKIFASKKLLNQIVFFDSLSKTLGMTGIRIGWFWTLNEELSQLFKRNTIFKKAGFSKMTSKFTTQLLSDMKVISNFISDQSNIISERRKEFISYMMKEYEQFFDFESSPKVNNNEGIYVLLKLKENVDPIRVFIETGIIGVLIKLSDGEYIRYSFGNINYKF